MKKAILFLSLCIGQAWALSCSTPVTLSAPELSHTAPKIAMNEKGEAVVVWVGYNKSEEEEEIPFAATWNAEKKWTPYTALSGKVDDVAGLKPFIDELGNAFASWKVYRGTGDDKEIYYQFAKKEKDKAWSSTADIFGPRKDVDFDKFILNSHGSPLWLVSTLNERNERDVGVMQYLPQSGEKKLTVLSNHIEYTSDKYLVRSKKGRTLALWSESKYGWDLERKFSSFQTLKGAWSQGGSSWSEPFVIHKVKDSNLTRIKAAMNSHQEVIVLWENHDLGKEVNTIQAFTYQDGQWSQPLELASSTELCLALKVALNEAGDIATTWSVPQGKEKDTIYLGEKAKGQPWSSPVALTTTDTINNEIAIDANGNIVAVWMVEENEEKWVVQAAYKPKGKDWSSPLALSHRTADCEHFSKIQTDDNGHFILVWDEEKNDCSSVHGAVLSTQTWQWSSALLSPKDQNCERASFALDKSGQGIITWLMEDNNEVTHAQAAELKID
jgi:hypothetical protein